MKKIISILMCIIATPCFATSMCASDDTISIVLDPTISGISNRVLDNFKLWETYMPYGSIRGTSACLSKNYGNAQTITDNGEVVIGGERNGGYCYCKMTHPALSSWFFEYSRGANCANECVGYCGSNVRANAPWRVKVFGSISAQ